MDQVLFNGLSAVYSFINTHGGGVKLLTINRYGRVIIHFDASVFGEAGVKSYMKKLKVSDYKMNYNYLLDSHSVSFKLMKL